MIKKLIYYSSFILLIFLSALIWPIIEIPYVETTIIGEYQSQKYNSNNDLIRYLVFIIIPVAFFIIIKFFNFRENINYF